MSGLEQFGELLRKWNAAIRLTGSASNAAFERHVEEARAVMDFLPEASRVVDVGAGNGFPGVVLGLLRPDLQLTLVEPIAKKVAFLRECRRKLGLDNVVVLRARDDEVAESEEQERFDVAISQATFPPVEWLTRGSDLVRDDGLVIAMLGAERADFDSLPFSVELHELEPVAGRPRAIAIRRVVSRETGRD